MSKFDAKKYRSERRAKRIYLGLCTRCDNRADVGKKDCSICIQKTKDRVHQRRGFCGENKLCISCNKTARPDALRCESCTVRLNKRNVERHKNIKTEVLSHYGLDGKLQCCWSDCKVIDIDMLTLDHIENDGAAHRKGYTRSGRGGGSKLYDLLIREGFPEGFQTLCANHNLKKHLMISRSN
jgi:hypothetical protein